MKGKFVVVFMLILVVFNLSGCNDDTSSVKPTTNESQESKADKSNLLLGVGVGALVGGAIGALVGGPVGAAAGYSVVAAGTAATTIGGVAAGALGGGIVSTVATDTAATTIGTVARGGMVSTVATGTEVRSAAVALARKTNSNAIGKNTERIDFKSLPKEAKETINKINKNGSFPYKQDGKIFHNRGGQLPKQKPGYYKEYTVKTPGAKYRGARRIVKGKKGELYYTKDHYETFQRIS